jgi:deazaflavin-dependent oxidoreductase (nitroreductase family)
MSFRTAWTDLLMKTMSRTHKAVLTLSGGRVGWSIGSLTAVELHTRGRSSGRPRSTMLTSPLQREGSYVLVASKGGDDRNPDWYLNLVANPDIELTVRGVTHPMKARTATAAEKALLWPDIVSANPGYAGYQRKTSRDIPVVICDPRPSQSPSTYR